MWQTQSDRVRFHRYKTSWECGPRALRRGRTYTSYYTEACNRALRRGRLGECESELVAEQNWLLLRQPYYKLWPAYAIMLSRTHLKVPTAAFVTPFYTFGVFLPDIPGLFSFVHEGRSMELRSMLVCSPAAPLKTCRVLVVVMDDGERLRSTVQIHMEPSETVGEALDRANHNVRFSAGPYSTSASLCHTALRLALGVSLLATSIHRVVEHDVIAALRKRYDGATTDEQRVQIFEKSRRNGVYGWRIGRGRCLALTTSVHADDFASGRELCYQHVRGGHFHTVCHGKNRSQRKVMFFEPTIVRPDLPPPPLVEMNR